MFQHEYDLLATRVNIAPINGVSRITVSPVLTTAKLLVVGIFKRMHSFANNIFS